MIFRDLAAKLRKKVVVTKRFWKINAIRPEIRARRGVEPLDKAVIMQGYANW